MRPALRIQLLRDNNFLEEDELKEIIESLANTVEDFRMISVGDESDGSEDEDEDGVCYIHPTISPLGSSHLA